MCEHIFGVRFQFVCVCARAYFQAVRLVRRKKDKGSFFERFSSRYCVHILYMKGAVFDKECSQWEILDEGISMVSLWGQRMDMDPVETAEFYRYIDHEAKEMMVYICCRHFL